MHISHSAVVDKSPRVFFDAEFDFNGPGTPPGRLNKLKTFMKNLKLLILYDVFDIYIFNWTSYEALLIVAMQKCRDGCTFSSKSSAS